MLDRARWLSFRLNSALLRRLRRGWTTAGRLVLCAAALSALLGFDTTQSMAYQSFTFFAAAAGLAWLLARRKPAGLRARRVLPRYGTAGEPLAYTIVLENAADAAREGLSVEDEAEDPRPALAAFAAEKPANGGRPFWLERLAGYGRWRRLVEARRARVSPPADVPRLPPRGRVEVAVKLTAPARGRLRLSRVSLSRPEPLGLARARLDLELPQSVLILPKRYPVPRLTLPGSRRYQEGGVALSSSVGDSEEFLGLRGYRPGDPLRRIHWRSWAKAGAPVVREFEDEYFTRHALILDTFAGPGRERAFEEAVSVAASFACSTLTQDSLLDLLFVGAEPYCVTAGRGLGGADRLLEALACAQARRDEGFETLMAVVGPRAPALSGAVCVLLEDDEPRRRLLALLRGAGLSVRAFFVVDEPEKVAEGPDVHALGVGRVAEDLARARP